jgi:hypothetical protein
LNFQTCYLNNNNKKKKQKYQRSKKLVFIRGHYRNIERKDVGERSLSRKTSVNCFFLKMSSQRPFLSFRWRWNPSIKLTPKFKNSNLNNHAQKSQSQPSISTIQRYQTNLKKTGGNQCIPSDLTPYPSLSSNNHKSSTSRAVLSPHSLFLSPGQVFSIL